LRVAERDVADIGVPGRRLKHQRALSLDRRHRLSAVQIEIEIPETHGTRQRAVIVRCDQVAETRIGVSSGAVPIEQISFRAGLQVDDAIVNLRRRIGTELLLDHEPATALVDLALVVAKSLLGKVRELIRVFAVHETAQIGVARSVLQRG